MAPKRRKAAKTVGEDVHRDLCSLTATSGLTFSALATVLKKIRSNPALAEVAENEFTIRSITSARFDAIEHVELYGCQVVPKEPTVEPVRLSKA